MPNDIYKPVTEDSLREFYLQIQPYLNADVPVIANKFDKANLYSETEKIVGQWIDGKPLYQKTIDCGTLPNSAVKSISHNIENIDIVTDARGIGIQLTDSGNFYPLPFSYPANSSPGANIQLLVKPTEIRISTGQNRDYIVSSYVTLQYTKTTDSPISIGADTDYSTTEKVIGTWIDGKPIYQITLTGATVPATNTVLMPGVDTVVNAFGSQCYSATTEDFNFPYVHANLNVRWIKKNGNVLLYRAGSDTTVLTNYRWTFQFTKA